MNRNFRRTAFIEIEIFCNININIFITFEQFKASLLKKSIDLYNTPQIIDFFKSIDIDSKLLNGIVYNVIKLLLFYFR